MSNDELTLKEEQEKEALKSQWNTADMWKVIKAFDKHAAANEINMTREGGIHKHLTFKRDGGGFVIATINEEGETVRFEVKGISNNE